MVSSNPESEADSLERYYLQEAEPTPDSKFVIKLQMPKSEKGVEEGETASSAAKKEHYCYDCEKSFSSGKALGGHMSSAHVQAGRDYQSKKLRLKNSTRKQCDVSRFADNGFGGDVTRKIICKICGKDFPTEKSLFGHMRCHPERGYRGMQPPDLKKNRRGDFTESTRKNRQSSSSDHISRSIPKNRQYSPLDPIGENFSDSHSSDDDDDERPVDLTKFLSEWNIKGQRGRQGNNHDMGSFSDQSPSSLPRAEAKKLSDAAYSLVSLGNGNHPAGHRDDEDRSNSMSSDGETVYVKSMRVDETKKEKTQLYLTKKAKDFQAKPIKVGERKPNSDADCYKDTRTCKSKRADQKQFSPVKKLAIGERKPERKIIQLAAYEGKGKSPMEPMFDKFSDVIYESGADDFSKRYESSKSFIDDDDDSDSEKTPEPVSHYLEHRKKNGFVPYKKRFEKDEDKEPLMMNTEAEPEPEPEPNLGSATQKKDAIAEITPEKYKCSTCNKGFSTHQALGGHRSSHNKLRVSIQNAVDDSSPENQYSNSNSQILETKLEADVSKLVENPHQCQICTRIFSSGQALGGHMRCHAYVPANQVESQEEDIPSAKKVLDFDLNKVPDIED